jgi:hypothetical protein
VQFLRRVALAAVVALTVMVLTMPLGQASSNARQAQYNADHQVLGPDVSTPTAYARLVEQYPEALDPAKADQVRASITLAKDGTFATTNPLFTKRVSRVNAAIRDYRSQSQQSPAWLGTLEAQAWFWCGYLPNWVLDAMAWYVIVVGSGVAAVGAFVDATIVGIPIGAVINGLGLGYALSGAFLLWYFDKYYPNGVWHCFWK